VGEKAGVKGGEKTSIPNTKNKGGKMETF